MITSFPYAATATKYSPPPAALLKCVGEVGRQVLKSSRLSTLKKSYKISNRMNVEEIRQFIGSDSLAFLPIKKLQKLLGGDAPSYCYACFSGDYPVQPTGKVKRVGDFVDDGLSRSVDGGWINGYRKGAGVDVAKLEWKKEIFTS